MTYDVAGLIRVGLKGVGWLIVKGALVVARMEDMVVLSEAPFV